MTKKELRIRMKGLNLSLTTAARDEASEKIFAAVEKVPAFAAARCVGLFCSLPDEPATEAVLARWTAERRVVVPRVEGLSMQFYDYRPSTMCRGAYGIAEPGLGARRCDPSEIDLIVVPGTAFTTDGGRLGRGRGYYDRYLSLHGLRAVKVGVCFAHQLVAELPAEPHDVVMNRVITG